MSNYLLLIKLGLPHSYSEFLLTMSMYVLAKNPDNIYFICLKFNFTFQPQFSLPPLLLYLLRLPSAPIPRGCLLDTVYFGHLCKKKKTEGYSYMGFIWIFYPFPLIYMLVLVPTFHVGFVDMTL